MFQFQYLISINYNFFICTCVVCEVALIPWSVTLHVRNLSKMIHMSTLVDYVHVVDDGLIV